MEYLQYEITVSWISLARQLKLPRKLTGYCSKEAIHADLYQQLCQFLMEVSSEYDDTTYTLDTSPCNVNAFLPILTTQINKLISSNSKIISIEVDHELKRTQVNATDMLVHVVVTRNDFLENVTTGTNAILSGGEGLLP